MISHALKLSRIVMAIAVSLCALSALGQGPPGRQETRTYSYGIGRIAWTFPDALAAEFAVPRWTAGPRVLCEAREVRCEVQVHVRDVSVPAPPNQRKEHNAERQRRLGPTLCDARP